MSDTAPAALEALHHAIGTNRATIGGLKISRKGGAIHVEISSADGALTVAIPPADALRIAAGMYHLAKDASWQARARLVRIRARPSLSLSWRLKRRATGSSHRDDLLEA